MGSYGAGGTVRFHHNRMQIRLCQCNRVEICRSRLGEAYQQLIDHEIARRIVKPVGAQKAGIGVGAARRKRAPKAKLLCELRGAKCRLTFIESKRQFVSG